MKNLIPIAVLCVLAFSGLFFAFTDSSESEMVNQLNESNKLIANQSDCIDDIEASLYDFSFEIEHLRTQNENLLAENENLRSELRLQTQRAADLRQEMIDFEVENYNLKRQLEQITTGREIRARHQANNTELNIAENIPTPTLEDATDQEQILEIQSKITTIEQEIGVRELALQQIASETAETKSNIEANESKFKFNIELEPASDPSVEFSDPLVSNTVLFDSPEDAPRLFTQLSMANDKSNDSYAEVGTEDEFSSKSPVYSLLENTNVRYEYIACRNDRYGKKVKKLKKDSRNWKYTFIQFNFETENINLLLNKEFRMRVLSTDLNTYVNFHTDQSKKSLSHFNFTYEGEPVKISLFNNDVKGKSFEVQIFYILDGEEYLLEGNEKDLFLEGISMIKKS